MSSETKQQRSDHDHDLTRAPDVDDKVTDPAVHARAGEALVRRVAQAGPIELTAAVKAKLATAFGKLPSFEVVVDPSAIPVDARAASDAKHIYLRDANDAGDVKLIGHEVAHVVQMTGGGQASAGLEASANVQNNGEIESANAEAHDERGDVRRSLEEEADRAADDLEAGRKIEALSSTPVSEGDLYLQPKQGRVPAKSVKLVLYPGERVVKDPDSGEQVTMGRMFVYVNGKVAATYNAASGPPDKGAVQRGHQAEPTPAGDYVLSREEHVSTNTWENSVIPWGAKLRERQDKEIEYSSDGTNWTTATGIHGTVTKAIIHRYELQKAEDIDRQNRAHARDPHWKPIKSTGLTEDEKAEAVRNARLAMNDDSGTRKLKDTWDRNDFGKWGFDMMQDGKRTPYYIHTTADNEKTTEENASKKKNEPKDPVRLGNSHGCVHIKPTDREEMMSKGYLQAGVKMTVKKYGEVGTDKNPNLIDL